MSQPSISSGPGWGESEISPSAVEAIRQHQNIAAMAMPLISLVQVGRTEYVDRAEVAAVHADDNNSVVVVVLRSGQCVTVRGKTVEGVVNALRGTGETR